MNAAWPTAMRQQQQQQQQLAVLCDIMRTMRTFGVPPSPHFVGGGPAPAPAPSPSPPLSPTNYPITATTSRLPQVPLAEGPPPVALDERITAAFHAGREHVLQTWRIQPCATRLSADATAAAVDQAVELSAPGCCGLALPLHSAQSHGRVALVVTQAKPTKPLSLKDHDCHDCHDCHDRYDCHDLVTHLVRGHDLVHIDSEDVLRRAARAVASLLPGAPDTLLQVAGRVLASVTAAAPLSPTVATTSEEELEARREALRLKLWRAGRGACSVVVTLHAELAVEEAEALLAAGGMCVTILPPGPAGAVAAEAALTRACVAAAAQAGAKEAKGVKGAKALATPQVEASRVEASRVEAGAGSWRRGPTVTGLGPAGAFGNNNRKKYAWRERERRPTFLSGVSA